MRTNTFIKGNILVRLREADGKISFTTTKIVDTLNVDFEGKAEDAYAGFFLNLINDGFKVIGDHDEDN